MGIRNKYNNISRGNKNPDGYDSRERRVSKCSEDRMSRTRNRIWDGWAINKLCNVNSNINTNMYNGKLGLSSDDDKTVLNITTDNRVIINRGIYSNGYIGILCAI